jgi:hypothetical protein
LSRGDAFGLFRTAIRDTAPFVRWIDLSLAQRREPLTEEFE